MNINIFYIFKFLLKYDKMKQNRGVYMRRRTDRHIEESGSSPTRLSRMSKNKYLYDDINNVIE